MTKMNKFIVGQTLWFVYSHNYGNLPRSNCEVTITKVGREWLTLSSGHRIDKHTLEVDGEGYASPGRCYLSRKKHEEEIAVVLEWKKFLRFLQAKGYRAPGGATVESIAQAMRILKLEGAE
jgi:hypothetical protein